MNKKNYRTGLLLGFCMISFSAWSMQEQEKEWKERHFHEQSPSAREQFLHPENLFINHDENEEKKNKSQKSKRPRKEEKNPETGDQHDSIHAHKKIKISFRDGEEKHPEAVEGHHAPLDGEDNQPEAVEGTHSFSHLNQDCDDSFNLEKFPDEILNHILSFVPHKDLVLNVAASAKRLNGIASSSPELTSDFYRILRKINGYLPKEEVERFVFLNSSPHDYNNNLSLPDRFTSKILADYLFRKYVKKMKKRDLISNKENRKLTKKIRYLYYMAAPSQEEKKVRKIKNSMPKHGSISLGKRDRFREGGGVNSTYFGLTDKHLRDLMELSEKTSEPILQYKINRLIAEKGFMKVRYTASVKHILENGLSQSDYRHTIDSLKDTSSYKLVRHKDAYKNKKTILKRMLNESDFFKDRYFCYTQANQNLEFLWTTNRGVFNARQSLKILYSLYAYYLTCPEVNADKINDHYALMVNFTQQIAERNNLKDKRILERVTLSLPRLHLNLFEHHHDDIQNSPLRNHVTAWWKQFAKYNSYTNFKMIFALRGAHNAFLEEECSEKKILAMLVESGEQTEINSKKIYEKFMDELKYHVKCELQNNNYELSEYLTEKGLPNLQLCYLNHYGKYQKLLGLNDEEMKDKFGGYYKLYLLVKESQDYKRKIIEYGDQFLL